MKKLALATVVSTLAFVPVTAQALVPFNIDLNSLGSVLAPDAVTTFDFTGVTTPPAPVSEIALNGASYVEQDFSGGSQAGQNFVDSGFLQLFAPVTPAGDVLDSTLSGVSSLVGTNDQGGQNYVYIEFVSLTGEVNALGDAFTFDTGVAQGGTIRLVVDDDDGVTTPNDASNGTARAPSFDGYCLDAACSTTDQSAIVLAEFQLVPVSGGTDLQFSGGAFVNGNIGVTLIESTVLNPGLFVDALGNPFDQTMLIRFVNGDATNFASDLTGVVAGDGTANFNIGNSASLTVAIPEPLTIGMVGVGLGLIFGVGASTRRKRPA